MLAPSSLVYRGTGASGAAHPDSTTTRRKLRASLVTRPALPVQVRAGVKSHILVLVFTAAVCIAPLCPLSSNPVKCVCLPHAAPGAGVEACNTCAEGYLMEEWRCVSSCSAGFYATEPNPEIADGHRICRR